MGTKKVRLVSIDTPETNFNGKSQGEHAERATAYLKGLLPAGTKIQLQTGKEAKDAYNRLLAHVFKNGLNVNRDLVAQGLAATYFIWPNLTYFKDYQGVLKEARDAKLGIWNPANPLKELPFEFRMRVRNEKPTKFVGDYETKKAVKPSQYQQIPVEKRVFFMKKEDLQAAGYQL
nr:thermonuclease family protein [Paenibacillus turpanensis]